MKNSTLNKLKTKSNGESSLNCRRTCIHLRSVFKWRAHNKSANVSIYIFFRFCFVHVQRVSFVSCIYNSILAFFVSFLSWFGIHSVFPFFFSTTFDTIIQSVEFLRMYICSLFSFWFLNCNVRFFFENEHANSEYFVNYIFFFIIYKISLDITRNNPNARVNGIFFKDRQRRNSQLIRNLVWRYVLCFWIFFIQEFNACKVSYTRRVR